MKRKNKDALVISTIFVLLVLFIAVCISGGVYWEISLWKECRVTNSFWYCVRVLGK